MDLDAYSAAHRDEWNRLADLSEKRRFSGSEADELIDRYQAGATQLSAIRTTVAGSIEAERLSVALSRARMRFTGASANVFSRLPEFFVRHLPAALYRIRWLSLAITIAFIGIVVTYALWVVTDPQVLAALGDEEDLKNYADEQFVQYYSEYSERDFGAMVWTNNAWLATQCILFGITGLYPAYLMFANAQGLGISAGVMTEYGALDTFLLYIAPHGQLEMYSIFVAGAAGLKIFWAWIAPGARGRGQALAEDGRALFTVVVGLTLALLVSGIIEGYVTRIEAWPWFVKIGIGTIALLGFLSYQWIVGRRAYRAGVTGDLDEFEAGARQLVAG